jgi:hypothetical protein
LYTLDAWFNVKSLQSRSCGNAAELTEHAVQSEENVAAKNDIWQNPEKCTRGHKFGTKRRLWTLPRLKDGKKRTALCNAA